MAALSLSQKQQERVSQLFITLVSGFVLLIFLAPLGYMFSTAIKSDPQMSDPLAPPYWPHSPSTFSYQGEELTLFEVPLESGVRELAMVNRTRTQSEFIDPANPDAGLITWEGNWRQLTPTYEADPQWGNYITAWDELKFPLLFWNTVVISVMGTLGAVGSSVIVAYGFARFNFRGKNLLFMILIATIIMPVQATLIPTYIIFSRIGWTNTLLPLIVPHFFANAYNVFLMRQYFMQIPRALDEAAMIDGAGPIRVFWSIMLPQAIPALTAVSLFHFFFAWNDFFTPLIYLVSSPELWPLSVGLQKFNALYGRQPNLIQAGALITLLIPVVIFFMAQKIFMRGIVFTGVDK